MAYPIVAGATTGRGGLAAEIDDEGQEADFRREWRNLAAGVPAPKTSEVASAFLLYTTVAGERCQLYLYDAPGEEFASIGRRSDVRAEALEPEEFVTLAEALAR